MSAQQPVSTRALDAEHGRAPKGRLVVLGLLSLVYAVSYADRQLILVLAEPIKAELRLTDTQVGLLGGFSFALFYTAFGVPIAWAADRWNRVRIVAAACALWSLFSAACGLAGGFLQLAITRMGVGIGEAGGTAPSFSILSDLFRPHERGRAIALFSFGSPAGVMIGTAVGGAVAAAYGWRAAFMVIGLPGVAIALAVLFLVREPSRGTMDPSAGAPTAAPASPLATIRLFLRAPALWTMTLASGVCGFVSLGLAAWTPAYLMRSKAMSLGEVSAYYSVVAGLAVCAGIGMGGMLGDRLAARNKSAYALLPAALFALSLPFLIGAILAPKWPLALTLLSVPLSCTTSQVPPALAFIHNSTPAAHRATASAIFLFVLNFVGIGGGPLFVGVLSDRAATAGVVDSLAVGLTGLAGVLVLAILALIAAARAISRQAEKRDPESQACGSPAPIKDA
jgi:predicted MFS family arabinose efflux permease